MVRVGATSRPATDILVSAYRDDTRLSVVAVNATSQARQQKFWLDGSEFGQVIPWVTSNTLSLAKQTAITATDQFVYSLPAMSVVTFVNWVADSELPSTSDAGRDASDGSLDASGQTGRDGSSGSEPRQQRKRGHFGRRGRTGRRWGESS